MTIKLENAKQLMELQEGSQILRENLYTLIQE